ncbi:MAG: 50S ribosomal protein L13 [Candidatus Micrarchaeota archaeon]
MLVIDGNKKVFGRMATHVAKKLILGEEVHVINAESILLTGDPDNITDKYLARRWLQHKGTPEKSPSWPRVPSMLIRRMIRGMLPRKKASGLAAYKRLRVYIGNPKNLSSNLELKEAVFKGKCRTLSMRELCRRLGY